MNDLQLVQYALQGDLDAFNRLVLAYQDMAYNLAYRILSDADAAEDVTQTAFLSAYRNLHSFRGGSFRAWLLRVVTNACYDELRRQQRHPVTALEPVHEEDDDEVESPAWIADDTPSPEQQIETRELDRAIQNCLDELPLEFRAVVIMVDIQGLDYQEASRAIGKPLGTVKSRLARARLRLRDCLEHLAELLPDNLRLGFKERG